MDNRIYKAFDSIHAEDELKRNTRAYISQKLQKRYPRPFFHMKYGVPALCCLFLMLGFAGYRFYITPVAAISIDINPSIELEINPFDRIVSTKSYNDDGARMIEHLNLKHLKYEDAVTRLLENEELEKYLQKDSLIRIAVTSEQESKSTEIQKHISSCAGNRHGRVKCHTGNIEDVEAAHKAGLSFGKYGAFLELQKLDPSVTVEDVQGLTMRQIQDLIDSHTEKDMDIPQNQNESNHERGHAHRGNGMNGKRMHHNTN